jgi:hypothetical protein
MSTWIGCATPTLNTYANVGNKHLVCRATITTHPAESYPMLVASCKLGRLFRLGDCRGSAISESANNTYVGPWFHIFSSVSKNTCANGKTRKLTVSFRRRLVQQMAIYSWAVGTGIPTMCLWDWNQSLLFTYDTKKETIIQQRKGSTTECFKYNQIHLSSS